MLDRNDKKYILRRIITYIAIAMIMFLISSCQAKADTIAPSVLQFYKPNRTNTWTRSPVKFTQQGQDFYHTSTTSINDVAGLYGVVNNEISGTYFSFNALVPPHDYWVVGELQLLDGSFVACQTNAYTAGGTETGFYTFTCEVKESVQVYKYGIYLTSTTGYGETENSVALSLLNGFSDKGEYNQYLINLQQSILGVESKLDAQTQALQDINNSITSEQGPTNEMDFVGYLPPGPVDSILNLPLQLLNVLANKLGGTCSPLTLTIPFIHETITLPCLWVYLGTYIPGLNSILNWVSVVADIYILYHYLIYTYKWVDDTLTLRENNQFGGYE